jgi:hypothetical protein
MSDVRTILEQGVGGATPPPDGFERMLRRRDRKRRNQRIAAGVVGIAVFVAAVGIVTSQAWPDRSQTPAHLGVSASVRAKTRVTFRLGKRGFRYKIVGGVVQSTRPACVEDRSVVVLRQAGHDQDPRTDEVFKNVVASSRGVWTTQVTFTPPHSYQGLFYAHVSRTRFCRADTSRTLDVAVLT